MVSSSDTSALVKSVMAAMLQNRAFDARFAGTPGSLPWTTEAVSDVLRSIPKLFFQSTKSIGKQKSFRHYKPLKQRILHLETCENSSKMRLGVNKSIEFYYWLGNQCGFVHNEITCREMCCVLAKSNSLKCLWDFLRKMEKLVTTSTVTCIIKVLGEQGLMKEALALFYRMKQLHCKPDVYAYNTIICALCRVGNFKKARFLLDQMEMPGSKCPPDVFTYTIFISFYCKRSLQTGCKKAIRRRLWEANHLFRNMVLKGFNPDVVTYNCLIDGLCKTYRIERAHELFDEMSQRGCVPNKVTYNSFIRYYSVVNEISKATAMLRTMEEKGHGIPTSSSYTPIIHALCEGGRFIEAQDFMIEMVEKGNTPRDYTYKLICDSLSSQELPSLPEEICRRIEDGIHNRFQRVKMIKPLMIKENGFS